MKKIITRELIANKIESLLRNQISIQKFGEEMFHYLAFDDEYEFEAGQEELIKNVLDEFSEMHDFDKEHAGYDPLIPSSERLQELKKSLEDERG